MSGWVRSGWLIFGLVAFASASARGGDQTAAARDVVSLSFFESKVISDDECPPPCLARELVRQAFFIAARDECGVRTCDSTLREDSPDESAAHLVPFELFCTCTAVKKDWDVCYTLSRRNGTATEKLDEWKYRTNVFSPKMINDLCGVAEEISRTKFKALLQSQGVGKPVPAARESASLPPEVEARLWEWNEFAVFGAIRCIHAEIREKGESPELLAGLAIGYANLGALTEYYYGPACKSFYARALLYAERLVRKTRESDWAIWHRAYVRAILGVYDPARSEVKVAKKAAAGKKPLRPLPFWTEVIDNLCEGQVPRMLEQAKTKDQRRLARFVNLRAVLYSRPNDVPRGAAQAMLEDCPDCLRAADALCSLGQMGPMVEVTSVAFPLFSKTLRSRLPDVYGFPAPIAKRLRDTKPAEDAQEKVVEDEVDFRIQLVTDIKAEATSGRDTLEPSLAALGQMIEESQFAQVLRRLELEGTYWGISTERTITWYRPLCAHHRYSAYIDRYSGGKAEADKVAEALSRVIETNELGYIDMSILNWLRLRSPEPGTQWAKIAFAHGDPIFSDEMAGMKYGAAGSPQADEFDRHYMGYLWETSSRLPSAIAIQIEKNWKRKGKFFSATVEKEYAEDPLVMAAFANRYLLMKQYDDAERCVKQKIHISRDYPSYLTLAAIYKAKGDMKLWQETLEQSLDLPSMALEQATIRNTIAQYHMERKEWKEAVGFADAAAESYSEWSMATAARCHEMLGDWTRSEAYMHAISERYSNSAMEWLLWCCRTGHGDKDAADTCARAHFESLGTSFYWQTREKIGIYYLLRNEPEKALVVFNQTYEQNRNPYDAMHAALAADALGKQEERDQFLSKLRDIGLGPRAQDSRVRLYKQLVELLSESLRLAPVNRINFKDLDLLISRAAQEETATNLEYFVGMFLKNRGETKKAHEYLIRSAQSTLINKYNHVLARQVLRDLKVPVPPPAENIAKTKK